VSEHSHAERMPRRIELSAEELDLLLGPGRFASSPDAGATSGDDAIPAPDAPRVADVPLTHDAHYVPNAPSAADAMQPPHGASRPIGDADLVQAMLGDAPNFEQLALRAIRERTGEDLARIVDGATADAMIATGTATSIGHDRAFVAPMAADLRAAWATWLRGWLDLLARTQGPRTRPDWDAATGFPGWHRVRVQAAHRLAGCRARRTALFVSVIRVEDVELWNRRSQVILDDDVRRRAAAAMDAVVVPGDEISSLDVDAFVVVSERTDAATEIAAALRADLDRLPGDGPRSLAVRTGTAEGPWDAVDPEALVRIAGERAAHSAN
jgi:GGDEF domain-containing protein